MEVFRLDLSLLLFGESETDVKDCAFSKFFDTNTRCVAQADVPAKLKNLRDCSTAVISAFVYCLGGMPDDIQTA
jgi:hypothetical protein